MGRKRMAHSANDKQACSAVKELLNVSAAALKMGCQLVMYLVLSQQRQVEQDLNWLRVSGHHDKLRDATVQSLGGCEMGERGG